MVKLNLNVGDKINWYGDIATVTGVYTGYFGINVNDMTIPAYPDEIAKQNKNLVEYKTNVRLILEMYHNDNGYCIYISDDMGGSGIEACGNTKEDAIEDAATYLNDYFSDIK